MGKIFTLMKGLWETISEQLQRAPERAGCERRNGRGMRSLKPVQLSIGYAIDDTHSNCVLSSDMIWSQYAASPNGAWGKG
jgi:hypothetical protein